MTFDQGYVNLRLTMKPTETNTPYPQYESHRGRHTAPHRGRHAAEPQADHGLTRRETRAIERAHEYLAKLRDTTNVHIQNKAFWPDAPIYSAVDKDGIFLAEGVKGGTPVVLTEDLETNQGVIEAYQARVNKNDWGVIAELDEKWRNDQPTEKEAETKFAQYESTDPRRMLKIGQFISQRIFGARQHWLNQKTADANQRIAEAETSSRAGTANNQYKYQSQDDLKKAA